MKRKIILFLIPIILLLLAGGALWITAKNDDKTDMPEKRIVRIEPSSLFEGDAKKLEPHLGLISGCVKVKYQGDKKYLNFSYKIWEDGKLKRKPNICGKLLEGIYDDEISISFKNKNCDGNLELSEFILADDNVTAFPLSDIVISQYAAHRPLVVGETLEAPDDKESAFWGYAAYNDGVVQTTANDSIEEAAKKADWAIVFYLSFSDEEPKPVEEPKS